MPASNTNSDTGQLKPWEERVIYVSHGHASDGVIVNDAVWARHVNQVSEQFQKQGPTKISQYVYHRYEPPTQFLGILLTPPPADDPVELKSKMPVFMRYVKTQLQKNEKQIAMAFRAQQKEYHADTIHSFILNAIQSLLECGLNHNRHLTLSGLVNLSIAFCTNLPQMATLLSKCVSSSSDFGFDQFFKELPQLVLSQQKTWSNLVSKLTDMKLLDSKEFQAIKFDEIDQDQKRSLSDMDFHGLYLSYDSRIKMVHDILQKMYVQSQILSQNIQNVLNLV